MDENWFYSEGDFTTCKRCGASVESKGINYIVNPTEIHDKWHSALSWILSRTSTGYLSEIEKETAKEHLKILGVEVR